MGETINKQMIKIHPNPKIYKCLIYYQNSNLNPNKGGAIYEKAV